MLIQNYIAKLLIRVPGKKKKGKKKGLIESLQASSISKAFMQQMHL